jgi:hypothetical protein
MNFGVKVSNELYGVEGPFFLVKYLTIAECHPEREERAVEGPILNFQI